MDRVNRRMKANMTEEQHTAFRERMHKLRKTKLKTVANTHLTSWQKTSLMCSG